MIALQIVTLTGWLALSLVGGLALVAAGFAIARLARGRWADRRLISRAAVGIGVLSLAVPCAAIVIYTNFVNDPPAKLDTNDLDNLVAGDDTSPTGGVFVDAAAWAPAAADTAPVGSDAAGECAAAASGSAAPEALAEAGDFGGDWVLTDESTINYRVPELLAGVETEGVGTAGEFSGSMTVAGNSVTAACLTVDVASMTSDSGNRDGQFRGRIMETDRYPSATFVLTEAIVLDEAPEAGGDAITAAATGELTLHGVTREVTFDVQIQAGADVIGALGSIPITFSDYDISDPSGGPAQVGDEGTLEFLLAFERA